MNLPEDRERKVALKANHSKVCKFPTADSCEPVTGLIVSELERAMELQRAMEPGRMLYIFLLWRQEEVFLTLYQL